MIALNWYLISHDLSVKHVINIYVNSVCAKLPCFLRLKPPALRRHRRLGLSFPGHSHPAGGVAQQPRPDLGYKLQATEAPEMLWFLKLCTWAFSNTQLRTVEGTL